MATSPEAHAKRRLVIETLRSKRADFENFVRARVAEQDVDEPLRSETLCELEVMSSSRLRKYFRLKIDDTAPSKQQQRSVFLNTRN